MELLQQELAETSRNLESALLVAVSHVGQKAVCEALERDKATISKFFSGDYKLQLTLPELAKLIAILELRLVDKSEQTADMREVESYMYLAKKWMNHQTNGDEE